MGSSAPLPHVFPLGETALPLCLSSCGDRVILFPHPALLSTPSPPRPCAFLLVETASPFTRAPPCSAPRRPLALVPFFLWRPRHPLPALRLAPRLVSHCPRFSSWGDRVALCPRPALPPAPRRHRPRLSSWEDRVAHCPAPRLAPPHLVAIARAFLLVETALSFSRAPPCPPHLVAIARAFLLGKTALSFSRAPHFVARFPSKESSALYLTPCFALPLSLPISPNVPLCALALVFLLPQMALAQVPPRSKCRRPTPPHHRA